MSRPVQRVVRRVVLTPATKPSDPFAVPSRAAPIVDEPSLPVPRRRVEPTPTPVDPEESSGDGISVVSTGSQRTKADEASDHIKMQRDSERGGPVNTSSAVYRATGGRNTRENVAKYTPDPLEFHKREKDALPGQTISPLLTRYQAIAAGVRRRQQAKYDAITGHSNSVIEDIMVEGYDWTRAPGDPLRNLYDNVGCAEALGELLRARINAYSSDLVRDTVQYLRSVCLTNAQGEIYCATDIVVEPPKLPPEHYLLTSRTYSVGVRCLYVRLNPRNSHEATLFNEAKHASVPASRIRTNITSGERYVLGQISYAGSNAVNLVTHNFLDPNVSHDPLFWIPIKVGSDYCYYATHDRCESELIGHYIIAGAPKTGTNQVNLPEARLYATTSVQIRQSGTAAYFVIDKNPSSSITSRGKRGPGRVRVFFQLQGPKSAKDAKNDKTIDDVSKKLPEWIPGELYDEHLIQLGELPATKDVPIGAVPIRFNSLAYLTELYLLKLKEANPGQRSTAVLDETMLAHVYQMILDEFPVEVQNELGQLADLAGGQKKMSVTYTQAVEHITRPDLGFAYIVQDDEDAVAPKQAMQKLRDHYGVTEAKSLYHLIIEEMFSQEGYAENANTVYSTRFSIVFFLIVTDLAITVGLIDPPKEDDWRNKQVTAFEDSGLLSDFRIALIRMQKFMVTNSDNGGSAKDVHARLSSIGEAVEKSMVSRIQMTEGHNKEANNGNTLEASAPIDHPTQAMIDYISMTVAARMNPNSRDAEKRGDDETRDPWITQGGRKDTPNAVGRRNMRSPCTHISRTRPYMMINTLREYVNRFNEQERTAERRGVRFDLEEEPTTHLVIVGYVTIGRVRDIDRFEAYLRDEKRKGRLPFDLGIYKEVNPIRNTLELVISFNVGRLLMPCFVVDRTKPGVVPYAIDFIAQLHEKRKTLNHVMANRWFIAVALPQILANGWLEFIDPRERNTQLQFGGLAEAFSSLDSITLPSGEVLRNQQNYVLPGNYVRHHIIGAHNGTHQSVARGPYAAERYKQEVLGRNPSSDVMAVTYKQLLNGHCELQEVSGSRWYADNYMMSCYVMTAVQMDSGTTVEEAHVFSPNTNFRRSNVTTRRITYNPGKAADGETNEEVNNSPYPVNYAAGDIRSMFEAHPHITSATVSVGDREVSVLMPQIGTQVYPGMIITPVFSANRGNITSRCVRADTKTIGVITEVRAVIDVATKPDKTRQGSYFVSELATNIEHVSEGTTGGKYSMESGQKGIGAITNYMVPFAYGKQVQQIISSLVTVKRDTPPWSRGLAINALCVNTWTNIKYYHGMGMQNPNNQAMKDLYLGVGYKPRVPMTDANGYPVGVAALGVSRMTNIYADETAYQENAVITGSDKDKDPMSGMPIAEKGSNAASISTQGAPYLPKKDPYFMQKLFDMHTTDLNSYVHCNRCEGIGYVRVGETVATIKCHTCTQEVDYDFTNGRITRDTSDESNFSTVQLRGLFYAAMRFLGILSIATKLQVDVEKKEVLGEYISAW